VVDEPNHTQLSRTKCSVRRGVAVICEKPFLTNESRSFAARKGSLVANLAVMWELTFRDLHFTKDARLMILTAWRATRECNLSDAISTRERCYVAGAF